VYRIASVIIPRFAIARFSSEHHRSFRPGVPAFLRSIGTDDPLPVKSQTRGVRWHRRTNRGVVFRPEFEEGGIRCERVCSGRLGVVRTGIRGWTRNTSNAGFGNPRRADRIDGLELERDSDARILELGIGWGDQAAQLLEAYPRIRLVGVDVSGPMIARAEERLAPWSDRVELHRRDLADPDALIGLGRIDGAISSMTLHHLSAKSVRRLYAAIAASMRSEGVLVEIDRVERPDSRWAGILHRIGFSPLRVIGPLRRAFDRLGVEVESCGVRGGDRSAGMRIVDRIAMLEAAGFACTFDSGPAAVTLVARRIGPSSIDR
jgi:SAM-dependent methyltransferase